MRVAYIILAHKYPEQLIRLIHKLNSKENTFLIHIDKNTSPEIYQLIKQELKAFPNVHFLNRYKTYWGSFQLVQATLEGIKTIFSKNIDCDYVSFLSGQDYPIKSNQYIESFLTKHHGKEFLQYSPIYSSTANNQSFSINPDRIENWFINSCILRLDPFEIPNWAGLKTRILVTLTYGLTVIKVLPKRRRFPAGFQPFGGSAFWSITKECANYIKEFVEQNLNFLNFFRFAGIIDEIFFHTIILNSPYKENVINDDLRYIVWSGEAFKVSHPDVLNKGDFEKLMASPDLFARKFDATIDAEILDLIDQETETTPVQANE
jgi:hypothetical protein